MSRKRINDGNFKLWRRFLYSFLIADYLCIITNAHSETFESRKEATLNDYMKYFSIILYLAAICSALSISISPTIYASGERVFFVTDILLIISSVLLLNEVLRKWKMNIYVILTFVFISYNSFSLYLKNILE